MKSLFRKKYLVKSERTGLVLANYRSAQRANEFCGVFNLLAEMSRTPTRAYVVVDGEV